MRGLILSIVAVVAGSVVASCKVDLGECDEVAARQVVHTDDTAGWPAYAGQALIDGSCGNGSFCHSESATDRHGAPAGLNFDLRLAGDAEDTERLRRAQGNVTSQREEILEQVTNGWMPPGAIGAEVRALGSFYRKLPELGTSQGNEILANWLACGAPVVERTENDRPAGVDPVGDIVPAEPGIDPATCEYVVCGTSCVDTQNDGAHCGGCDQACIGDQVCFDGGCLDGGCPNPTTQCGQSCVDVLESDVHCGECDNACAAAERCEAGDCACNEGLTACLGACVDLLTSTDHCGLCGMACGSGQSCVDGTCSACGTGTSFADDVEPILNGTCTGSMCHDSSQPAGGLSLVTGGARDELLQDSSTCPGAEHIVPGDAAGSYLIEKLTNSRPCRGSQMPKGQASLSAAEVAVIEDWICGGALAN